ncbi:MAG: AMP-binding protein [Proteobacteria bacterium]|nr:AMP-binding protein [Pseudomonadota bacterium]
MTAPHPHPFWPKDLPGAFTLPATSLHANLRIAAERYPHKPAYVYYGSTLTWGALRRDAEALAGWLQQRGGVRRGDRVAVMGQSSPLFATAVHAVLRADAVVVPLNVMNLGEEIAHCLRDSGARVLVAAQELMARIAPLLGGLLDHVVVHAYADALSGAVDEDTPAWVREPLAALPPHAAVVPWAQALGAGLAPAPHAAGPDDAAAIAYTSGTTGRPKGCLHTHRSLMAAAITPPLWRGDRPDSVFLGVATMFHMQGLQALIHTPAYLGNTVVLLPRWDARAAARLIERHRVKLWGVSPAMLLDLLALPDIDRVDLSSLDIVTGGGAALPAAVNARLEALGVRYLEAWGMTETASMAAANPPRRSKRQCLGIPTFGVTLRVADPASGEPVADGEAGELWVAGPQVMKGYWNQPQADAETFCEVDGLRFLRTGDLVTRDAEGYHFLVDRLKRMINASGYKVWPAEVEAVLHGHPAVQEACVISSVDARRGESVLAVVVRRAGCPLEADELIAWARTQMAAYKAPRAVRFAERLPRSATGKIDWRTLQQQELG